MGLVAAIIAVVVVVCFSFSIFLRRHGESDQPQAGWRRTEEAFHDPSTNRATLRARIQPTSSLTPDQSGGADYVLGTPPAAAEATMKSLAARTPFKNRSYWRVIGTSKSVALSPALST